MMKSKFAFIWLGISGLGLAMAQPLVGVAFDAGGKSDRSFNQSTWEGAERAAKELGAEIYDFEPRDPSQVPQGVRGFAAEDFDLVIGVGFANEPAVTTVAREFPDVNFAVIDAVSPVKENVASINFREEEGSYLVGYAAGKLSQTGVVGFVGGMDTPLIHKFEAGYRAGIQAACPDCELVSAYVGNTPSAWNDPGRAKEITRAHFSRGADIIFVAAGGSGTGVIDAVREKRCLSGVKFRQDPFASVPKDPEYTKACSGDTRPVFFIGVDANQNYLGDFDNNPETLNHGLTSMVKRVDQVTYTLIQEVTEDKFAPGEREFGLAEDGVGFALDQYNQTLIPADLVDELEAISQRIVAKELVVPAE